MVDGMYHSPKISYEISWLCSTGSCSMLECCFVSGLSCFCHRFPPHIHSSSARAAAPKLGSSRWPWIFEEPRRVSELPEEEKFSGFGGLDELFIGDSQPDLQADSQPCHQFKVNFRTNLHPTREQEVPHLLMIVVLRMAIRFGTSVLLQIQWKKNSP